MSPRLRVAVVGAGQIGCYVGGLLAATADVTLIGRPAVLDAVAERGLAVGPSGGPLRTVEPDRLTLATQPKAAAGADVVLVSVKSRHTAEVARDLRAHLPPDAVVVSLQNGLHNAETLAATLSRRVLAGMVGFNVVSPAPGTFTRATSGDVMVEDDPALGPLLAVATAAGLPVVARADMPAVLRAKLLLNLNNAVNALSGVPLAVELADRDFRRVLARCQTEALAAFAAEGPAPARLTPLPPAMMTRILRAPDPVFRMLARAALQVHPDARSSMSDDLRLGRPTEVDELQGAVTALGRRHGIPTPVCDRVTELVRAAEQAGPDHPPAWRGAELLAAVTS